MMEFRSDLRVMRYFLLSRRQLSFHPDHDFAAAAVKQRGTGRTLAVAAALLVLPLAANRLGAQQAMDNGYGGQYPTPQQYGYQQPQYGQQQPYMPRSEEHTSELQSL